MQLLGCITCITCFAEEQREAQRASASLEVGQAEKDKAEESDSLLLQEGSRALLLMPFCLCAPAGDAGDRCCCEPPGELVLPGRVSLQPWQETPGSWCEGRVFFGEVSSLVLLQPCLQPSAVPIPLHPPAGFSCIERKLVAQGSPRAAQYLCGDAGWIRKTLEFPSFPSLLQ